VVTAVWSGLRNKSKENSDGTHLKLPPDIRMLAGTHSRRVDRGTQAGCLRLCVVGRISEKEDTSREVGSRNEEQAR
jgi:hypothetical protein